jgi:hypothetical protein
VGKFRALDSSLCSNSTGGIGDAAFYLGYATGIEAGASAVISVLDAE